MPAIILSDNGSVVRVAANANRVSLVVQNNSPHPVRFGRGPVSLSVPTQSGLRLPPNGGVCTRYGDDAKGALYAIPETPGVAVVLDIEEVVV
jgi:hypothetical protein